MISPNFEGDAESSYLFDGFERFQCHEFSRGLGLLVAAVPSLGKLFANPGEAPRLPKSPRKLANLIKHRAASNQIGRGYKILWGVSRDIKPYQEKFVEANDDKAAQARLEIKVLFHLPNGETCGCVEFPRGNFTFFYKKAVKKVIVFAEGVPETRV